MAVLLGQHGGFIGGSLSAPSNAMGLLSVFSTLTGLVKSIPVIGAFVSVASLATTLQGLMLDKFIVSAMPSKK